MTGQSERVLHCERLILSIDERWGPLPALHYSTTRGGGDGSSVSVYPRCAPYTLAKTDNKTGH